MENESISIAFDAEQIIYEDGDDDDVEDDIKNYGIDVELFLHNIESKEYQNKLASVFADLESYEDEEADEDLTVKDEVEYQNKVDTAFACDEEADEELTLKNKVQYQNKVFTVIVSDKDEEGNGYGENEDHSLKQYDENLAVETLRGELDKETIRTLTNELNQLKLAKDAGLSAVLKDMETLKKQNESLKIELKESKEKVEELTAYKEKMDDFIKKTHEERTKINEEHKRNLNGCRKYYLNLYSDFNQLEQEKADKNFKVLKRQHEASIKKLTDELIEVKYLYLNVCKENDGIYERLKREGEVEKNKLKEIWEEEKKFETETSKRKFSEEVSKQVAENVKEAKQLWEKEQTIKIQENVLAQVKEILQHIQKEKISDSEKNAIADNNYLKQIKELKARAKKNEEAFQKYLQECEWKQMKDVRVALENQREQMEKEFKERLQKKMQDKELPKLKIYYENQKKQALEEQKADLLKHYDNASDAQKKQCLNALDFMKAEVAEYRKFNHVLSSKLQRLNREYQEERNSLRNDLDSLQEKCARLENDKTSLAFESCKVMLESHYKTTLDPNEQEWASRQEERVVNPMRKEMATLK